MNNLFSHIEYLLLRHDCVIVPGLGAFIANMQPAHIDMELGKIIPPHRELMFNQAVKIDDGLLASSYSRKYGISFQEARQVLARNVNSLLDELHGSGNVECGKLGSLMLGEERRLQFQPNGNSYGRENKWMPELDILPSSTSKVNPNPCYDTVVEDSQEKMNDTVAGNYYNLRISKAFTKISAACVIVMALTLAFFLYPIPSDDREQRASVVPVEAFIPTKAVEESVAVDEVAPVHTDTIETAAQPTHYLIVATFSSSSEASKFAKNYSSDEYPMETVDSRKLSRVAIASSDSKDVLLKKLNSKEIASKFPGAWIWSRN